MLSTVVSAHDAYDAVRAASELGIMPVMQTQAGIYGEQVGGNHDQ